MKASMFVFGTDLVHEGYDNVLGNLADRAGVQAVSVSATYHNARDVFPHNPVHRVYRHEGDISWFVPRAAPIPPGWCRPWPRTPKAWTSSPSWVSEPSGTASR